LKVRWTGTRMNPTVIWKWGKKESKLGPDKLPRPRSFKTQKKSPQGCREYDRRGKRKGGKAAGKQGV